MQTDLDAVAREFLTQCGPHDYAMPEYGCQCASADYRPVMARLVDELRVLRRLAEATEEEVDTARAVAALDPSGDEYAEAKARVELAAWQTHAAVDEWRSSHG